MTTLEDLYYGNIHPSDQDIKRGSMTDQIVKLICKNEDDLTATLTEQQKEIFEKFKDCQSELSGMIEREAFRDGFILVVRIMAEVMEGLEMVEEIWKRSYSYCVSKKPGLLIKSEVLVSVCRKSPVKAGLFCI